MLEFLAYLKTTFYKDSFLVIAVFQGLFLILISPKRPLTLIGASLMMLSIYLLNYWFLIAGYLLCWIALMNGAFWSDKAITIKDVPNIFLSYISPFICFFGMLLIEIIASILKRPIYVLLPDRVYFSQLYKIKYNVSYFGHFIGDNDLWLKEFFSRFPWTTKNWPPVYADRYLVAHILAFLVCIYIVLKTFMVLIEWDDSRDYNPKLLIKLKTIAEDNNVKIALVSISTGAWITALFSSYPTAITLTFTVMVISIYYFYKTYQ